MANVASTVSMFSFGEVWLSSKAVFLLDDVTTTVMNYHGRYVGPRF